MGLEVRGASGFDDREAWRCGETRFETLISGVCRGDVCCAVGGQGNFRVERELFSLWNCDGENNEGVTCVLKDEQAISPITRILVGSSSRCTYARSNSLTDRHAGGRAVLNSTTSRKGLHS